MADLTVHRIYQSLLNMFKSNYRTAVIEVTLINPKYRSAVAVGFS